MAVDWDTGPLGTAVLGAARDAFSSGLHIVAFSSGLHIVAAIAAIVQAGMAILIVTRLRRIPPLDRAETPDAGPAPATADAGTTSCPEACSPQTGPPAAAAG